MIKKIIFTSFRAFPSYPLYQPLRCNNFYIFSTQQEVQTQTQAELDAGNDRAATFYRNSVRRININDKGRGKFTQHHLLRLIKLTQNVSQTPLLLEAYYNYLGHFTVISNSVVDKMLQKVLSFQSYPFQSVLQVYSNHNYLGYFPGYTTTNKLLRLVENNEEQLGKVLLMLSRNSLIKWNQQITQNVMNILKNSSQPQKIFSTTIKILAQKHFLNILGSKISAVELLKYFSQRITDRFQTSGVFNVKPSQYLLAFLRQIQEKSQVTEELKFQLALLSLTFGSKEILYGHLISIKNKQKQDQLFGYLKQANQLFINQVIEYFNTQELDETIKSKLQSLTYKE